MHTTRRGFVKTLAALAIAGMVGMTAFVTGCGGTQDDTVRVGSINSMTGPVATFGQSSDKGIRLAAKERGKVLGKPITIVTADTESTTDKTALAINKLLNQDKVVAVLGEVASRNSLAAAPECQRARVPMLTPASTNPRVTQMGDYIFRSCFTDDFQGQMIARFAGKNLGLKRAALLVNKTDDYSNGLAKAIRKEWADQGNTLAAEESYATGDVNFKTQLTNLRQANPEIIFLPGYYDQIPMIVQQARELGMTQPFIGGDGWDSEQTLTIGGKAVEGCYFTNHYYADDPSPLVQAFVEKFRKEYGSTPDAMAVLGYDAANIMFDAIERAGTTEGPKLRDALAATKNHKGVTGTITIGPDRNAVKPLVVLKIENGKFNKVTVMEQDAAR